jgi:hypothetical protein
MECLRKSKKFFILQILRADAQTCVKKVYRKSEREAEENKIFIFNCRNFCCRVPQEFVQKKVVHCDVRDKFKNINIFFLPHC